MADDTRACAIAAIGGAKTCNKKKHSVWVPVDQSQHRAVVVFTKRVFRLTGSMQSFSSDRYNGSSQGLQRVCSIYKTQIIWCDGYWKNITVASYVQDLVFRQINDTGEIFEACKAGAQLPAPVVPLVTGDFRKELFYEGCGMMT
jgi:hypothetical protein